MQRTARGALAQPFGEMVDARRLPEQGARQLRHLRRAEPRELDLRRQRPQLRDANRGRTLAPRAGRDDDDQRVLVRDARQAGEETEARAVGALDVVHLHDERPLATDLDEPAFELARHLLGVALRRRRSRRRDPEARPYVRPQKAESSSERAGMLAGQFGQRVQDAEHEAADRSAALLRHARVDADDGGRPQPGADSDLLQQPAPTHPRDRLDPDGAAVPFDRGPHQRASGLEGCRAPDEPRIGEKAQREPLGLGRALVRQLAHAREPSDDLRHARRPREGIGGQKGEDERVERGRDAWHQRGRRGRIHLPVRRQVFEPRRRIRVPARQYPVGQRSEGIEVRALVQRCVAESLGRHDGRRSGDHLGMTERREGAEVEQLAAPVVGHPHVRGAEVAVQEAARVQEREGRRDIANVQARLPVRQRRHLPHVAPRQELHRVIGARVVHAVVEDANDAGMVEGGEHVVLALEGLDDEPLIRGPGACALERPLLPGDAVEYAVDGAHSARRELLDHGVAPDRGRALDPRRRRPALRCRRWNTLRCVHSSSVRPIRSRTKAEPTEQRSRRKSESFARPYDDVGDAVRPATSALLHGVDSQRHARDFVADAR